MAEAGHLDRGHRRVVTLVSRRAARARLRLFIGIRGQNTERDGQSGLQCHLLQSPRGFAGYVIEMWSFAADYRTKGDDRVVTVTVREHLGGQGELERSGHVKDFEALGSGLLEGL